MAVERFEIYQIHNATRLAGGTLAGTQDQLAIPADIFSVAQQQFEHAQRALAETANTSVEVVSNTLGDRVVVVEDIISKVKKRQCTDREEGDNKLESIKKQFGEYKKESGLRLSHGMTIPNF